MPFARLCLARLGRMYGSGGAFTENIDRAGGEGTAVFAAEAIRLRCTRGQTSADQRL